MIDTKTLQSFLADKGFYRGKIDGAWGVQSEAAAIGWARMHGSPSIVHWDRTRARLAVEQGVLADAGLYAGTIDGVVGAKTEAARRAWVAPSKAKPIGLVALIGAAAAVLLGLTLDRWEGNELRPYRDIVGIWTVCRGETANVDRSRVYTAAECAAVNDGAAVRHVEPILACAPTLRDAPPEVIAAHGSLAYNIGTAGWCGSTAARRLKAGDLAGSCEAIMLWTRADGRVVQGLVNRRTAERALCRKGL